MKQHIFIIIKVQFEIFIFIATNNIIANTSSVTNNPVLSCFIVNILFCLMNAIDDTFFSCEAI